MMMYYSHKDYAAVKEALSKLRNYPYDEKRFWLCPDSTGIQIWTSEVLSNTINYADVLILMEKRYTRYATIFSLAKYKQMKQPNIDDHLLLLFSNCDCLASFCWTGSYDF